MHEAVFVDTNVLVYVRDAGELERSPKAKVWLEYLWKSHSGRLSFQVLQEYYAVVTQKLNPGLGREHARKDIESLMTWSPIQVTEPLLVAAWGVQDDCKVSWWDSLIVAAASLSGCRYLLSEDFQHERVYKGVMALDPFQISPIELAARRETKKEK